MHLTSTKKVQVGKDQEKAQRSFTPLVYASVRPGLRWSKKGGSVFLLIKYKCIYHLQAEKRFRRKNGDAHCSKSFYGPSLVVFYKLATKAIHACSNSKSVQFKESTNSLRNKKVKYCLEYG